MILSAINNCAIWPKYLLFIFCIDDCKLKVIIIAMREPCDNLFEIAKKPFFQCCATISQKFG